MCPVVCDFVCDFCARVVGSGLRRKKAQLRSGVLISLKVAQHKDYCNFQPEFCPFRPDSLSKRYARFAGMKDAGVLFIQLICNARPVPWKAVSTAFAEFFDELVQFFRPPPFLGFSRLRSFFALSLFAEALT